MNFGLFMMPVHYPGKGLSRTIKEDMSTIIRADELGFHEAWVGEHFTVPWENFPAPDLFIAQALVLTKNIKLGTGVVLLQLHDPKMLAHRIAMLDHLAEGRFYFGIGTGGVPTEFEFFNVAQDKRHARAAEVIEAVIKIWEADGPLDYQGEFHHVTSPTPIPIPEGDLRLWFKPYTRPHPPIAVAGVSPNSSTIEWAGEHGWIPLTTDLLPLDQVSTHWEAYNRGATKAGRTPPNRRDWRICLNIHVAETTEDARNDVLNHGMARTYNEYFLPLLRQMSMIDLMKPDKSMPQEAITVEYLMDNRWVVGDPEHCLGKIREAYDSVGGFGTLLQLTQDWDPAEKGLKSMELFAKYVVPELKDLWPAPHSKVQI
jgi:alkanesulfonate monooxygenase SsuD/methylene tetrahydromethanopterin reductase-like flavin-dependent oxidoreductase (luciferase family)